MSKVAWLLSAAVVALGAASAHAQDSSAQIGSTAGAAAQTSAATASPTSPVPTGDDTERQGEIVVTATRRASPLSSVPLAVSAVTAQTLQNSGATDIRQLNQLAPSLYVSSTSSEAGAGGARIRGIGTVGDNAGLESSVATFIDGVYRNRAGVGLTELGPVDRIEVLRGPQGTLFGRNASAGLINVVTAKPKFTNEVYGEGSYGNYDYYRLAAGITGPLAEGLAFRLDGVYQHRDGFLKDVISGRDVNNRDRYLIRGKLLYEPSDDLSVLLIGDYSHRNEECCAAPYLPTATVTRAADGTLVTSPSAIAALERSLTSVVPGAGKGLILDNTYNRDVAITPGRSYRSDVRDWGGSGEINWNLGGAKLTSITAYRDWKYIKGQDADFNNLDILYRPDDGSGYTQFKTFSQEVRLQGSVFNDRVDWLVGGYYSHEKLGFNDNLMYGADYDQYARALGAAGLGGVNPALGALFGATGFGNLRGFASGFVTAQAAALGVPAAARPLLANTIASVVNNVTFAGTGELDIYRQTDRNLAAFTHNIVHLTDKIDLTLGARYTDDRKRLNVNYGSTSQCGVYTQNIAALRALAAGAAANPAGNGGLNAAVAGLSAALANQVLASLTAVPCVINGANFAGTDKKKEGEWSGTAVLSFKPTSNVLTYASYSRGYKAGGFNLDRAPLFNAGTLASTTNLDVLKFQPEKVDAYEIGAKYNSRTFNLNVAAFYQMFRNFQLNSFNGVSFFVTDVKGCKDDLGTTDSDQSATTGQCSSTKSGVTSKGVEVEAFVYPSRYFTVNAGFTYSDTKYGKNLASDPNLLTPQNGNALDPSLFLLPGSRLSNSSLYSITGSATWTPPLTDTLKGLAYLDFRYTSELNTGSDLAPEKIQPGTMIVNGRIGVGRADGKWGIELFAQNLFNVKYEQVAFDSPLQGQNNAGVTQAFGTASTKLFNAFLAEPRTYGVTVRTRF